MKHEFRITVEHTLQGVAAQVEEMETRATGMDAVAAIRALVDRTAELTNREPEDILGMVEKHLRTMPKKDLLRSAPAQSRW